MKNFLILFALLNAHCSLRAMENNDTKTVQLLEDYAERGFLNAQQFLFKYYSDEKNINLEKAANFAQQVVDHDEATEGDKISAYLQLAEIFLRQHNLKKALLHFYLAISAINDSKDINEKNEYRIYSTTAKIAELELLLKGNILRALNYCAFILGIPNVDHEIRAFVMTALGRYLADQGGAKNMQVALQYFDGAMAELKAAHKTPVTPCYHLVGSIHEYLGHYSRAAEFYVLASHMGCELSSYSLGHLYENGLGLEKNAARAREYYEQGQRQKMTWEYNRTMKSTKKSHELDALFKQVFSNVK